MNTTKKSVAIFYLFTMLAILAFAYWAMASNTNSSTAENELIAKTDTLSEDANSAKVQEQPIKKTTNIYYGLSENDATKIYLKSEKENKLIYRDNDENDKVQKTYGVVNNKIIIADSVNSSYKINMLNTDGSGKKEVISSNIFSANAPEVSTDTTWLLTTTFSNAERDYGFSLFIQNISGANKRKISLTNSGNIISPKFSYDTKKVAYITTNNSNESKIFVYQNSSSETTEIYSTSLNLFELAWLGDDLIFSATDSTPLKSNSIELYRLNIAEKTTKKITDDQDCEKNLLSINDNSNVVYINSSEPQDTISQIFGTPEDVKKAIDFNSIKASYIVGIE
ncbi:hypothetical protein CO101_01940 [Candidatus Berkelbacteria bacterium CG_4_9_14_3_um_filter_39_23]|uniref:Dipeptidylpeptidase IV N-terminal domain-containing protein n=2 Tax=Candidatus Berkelbacteria TaxID=1618330 RepID=A0A2M7CII1_9BACT|nr:MAG: hypothetical protein AUK14_00160 [Candidatus Berkelbacteria bacterium CG2_30_39_44]PIR28105.1 MAG: hypothetical protein COV39_00860 [Candidatus Berkelbacteria bacterium CG11_big_fil_rev_8_21_14_0_20_40_23]PIV25446.1 MAG: hypothetical protein COS38_01420 [Candidatus Berkelbacteria bacterium CG03_land_8_20_14_0_80_40_36]PIX30433.1 MAG: hypothetical protein COZ62_02830 [Candidatus Berkelbacteria bacterium CG_4_8_14_3_um_filter_39_27]PIZ28901.1 MAG: hypothetical protein COY44_01755 [Candida